MKLYVEELGTLALRTLLAPYDGTTVFSSILAPLEVRCALQRRYRDRELSDQQMQTALGQLQGLQSLYTLWPVETAIIEFGYQATARHTLRALDAVQLGSALHIRTYLNPLDEFVFIASDDKLLKAAEREGLLVFDPTKSNEIPPVL
jgi:predicted nucleic acid-binding protein